MRVFFFLNQPTPPLECRRVVVWGQQLKRLENRTQRDDGRLCVMSPIIKSLIVVFGGMAVMVVTTVCGAMIGYNLYVDAPNGVNLYGDDLPPNNNPAAFKWWSRLV